MDYNGVNQTLIYRVGRTIVSFDVTIIDDPEAEGNEAFEIAVTPIQNIIVLTPVIRVTILCDENDGGISHLLYDEYLGLSFGGPSLVP